MKASDFYNPLMRFILRSPWHGVISGSTLLLTFTGRKSGKRYTLPISYAQAGKVITLITSRKHGWWKNLQGTAPVVTRVNGRDLDGTARVVAADSPTLIAELQNVYRGLPPGKAAQIAPEVVMIKIELN